MQSALILGLVGALLVIAFLANRIFRLTRLPDVVLLMALGVLLGPVLGLVDPERLSKATNLLGTLAIILVLFEGGLELNLRDTLRHFPGSLLLAFLAYVFSTGLVALILIKGMHLPVVASFAVGAALGCTSSTVVLPVLQQVHAEEPVKATLMLEASWGDVLAVLTVGFLISMNSFAGPLAQGLLNRFLTQVGLALLFAVTVGILWSRLLRILSEQRFWQVLTFSIVLVLYAGMEALGVNGLIAVLGFGLTISNFPGVDPSLGLTGPPGAIAESQRALLTFHSELAFLVRTFFFVLIGAVAELGTFRYHPLLIGGTLGALFLARWLAVQCSRWSWREIGPEGRELIIWMLPRGLITVVLAIQVVQGRGTEVAFLPGLAFAVILATNLLVVLGSVRAARHEIAPPTAVQREIDASGPVADTDTAPMPAKVVHSRRWILDAALLLFVAFGAVVLWYGDQPLTPRRARIEGWVQAHVHMARRR
ncbi:MAG: cation:proton antiporter [Acidobacteriales bacterium]|nr:cation:proton antiporter [Terriglobales bacterium]